MTFPVPMPDDSRSNVIDGEPTRNGITSLGCGLLGEAQASIECEPQVLQCGTFAAGNQFSAWRNVKTQCPVAILRDGPVKLLTAHIEMRSKSGSAGSNPAALIQFSPPIHTVAPSSRNPIAVGAARLFRVFLAASGLGIIL